MHGFTDGRDTLPARAPSTSAWWSAGHELAAGSHGRVRVGSVVGRYYAMDRDRRWERIQRAYDLLVHGRAAHHAASGARGRAAAYERGETDEFIAPTLGRRRRRRSAPATA